MLIEDRNHGFLVEANFLINRNKPDTVFAIAGMSTFSQKTQRIQQV